MTTTRKTSLRSREELEDARRETPAQREQRILQERAEIDLQILDVVETLSFYPNEQSGSDVPISSGVVVEAGTAEFETYIYSGVADLIDDSVAAFIDWHSLDDRGARAAAEFRLRLDATEAAIARARKELEAYG